MISRDPPPAGGIRDGLVEQFGPTNEAKSSSNGWKYRPVGAGLYFVATSFEDPYDGLIVGFHEIDQIQAFEGGMLFVSERELVIGDD